MADAGDLKKGTDVKWDTPQGETEGKVVDSKDTKNGERFVVKSDKSGKTATHKPDALDKK